MATTPKTFNERWLDALLAHQIYLLRHAGYIRNRVVGFLNATEGRIAEILTHHLGGAPRLATPGDLRRLERIRDLITRARAEGWKEATAALREDMVALAQEEPLATVRILQANSPVVLNTRLPDAAQLRSIALARPFQGRVLRDWASTMQRDDAARLTSAVQTGMVAGQPARSITRMVLGTARLNGSDGATELTRRQVQAVVRTAVAEVAGTARAETYRQNADLFEEELFVATLDARTTPQCRGLDGKRFPLGKGPQPPLHYQCRSLRVPVIGEGPVGERPARPFTQRQLLDEYARENDLGKVSSRDRLPRGHKSKYDAFERRRMRELTGRVPAQTSYNQWLGGQSAKFQDDVLGPTRGKLFRAGELSLDRFTNRNGDELTLRQLAEREAAAFRRAGLDPEKY